MNEDTIFHKIVGGEVPCHRVYEDEDHLAFLSIFPNTKGVTVVIPKVYQPSNFADVNSDVMSDLIEASQKVARILEGGLDDVGRVGLVFEGFGVDYLHAKLFPMHGTDMDEWEPIHSKKDDYVETYQGYLSSHDGKRADDQKLERLAKQLRKTESQDLSASV